MFGGLLEKAKQAQIEMKQRLSEQRIEKSLENGAVTVSVDGNRKILSIKISDELIKQGSAEVVEDLVTVALTQAMHDAELMAEEEMKNIAGGMLPPGLF